MATSKVHSDLEGLANMAPLAKPRAIASGESNIRRALPRTSRSEGDSSSREATRAPAHDRHGAAAEHEELAPRQARLRAFVQRHLP